MLRPSFRTPLRPRHRRTRIAAAIIVAAASTAVLGGSRRTTTPETAQAVPRFAGSESCRPCHVEEYEAWAPSAHGTAGGPPGPETVIAPFGGRPIRFADAVVSPLVDGDGNYLFRVERERRPPLELAVSGVIGKGHMVGGGTQGYMTTFPDGTERFLPFDYSEDADTWFCNTAFVGGFWVPGADRARLRADAGWLPISEEMRLTECGDWPPVRILGTSRRFANCQNCHGSQIEVGYRPDQQRYETRFTTLRINCESCHGPAAIHVEQATAGALTADAALPALDTLATDASLAVCFQCHALKRALDPGPAGPPVDHGLGPPPVDYSLGLPLVGDSPYFPDGRIATFGYQQTHRSSACYLFGSMTCVDCHAPHSQDYRDAFGNPLQGRFDDGQCTACHAGIAAEPERHTFHPAGSAGAACVSCHMPHIQHPELSDAIPYGRSDHTISIPRPGVDEAIGLQSACAQCHGDMTAAELAAEAEAWWGEIRPHRTEVVALAAAQSPTAGQPELDRALAETAALGDRHALAKLMALDAWVLGWVESGAGPAGTPPQGGEVRNPGTEEVADRAPAPQSAPGLDDRPGRSLAAMAEDGDEDVRSVAAAALHATRGGHPDVRALLDRLPLPEADPSRLRARWAAALTQWAAAAERAAGPDAGLHFLRRAQEVLPDAPETLVALGAGLAGAGAVEEAVQTYLEALRRRPDDPVALVNLGLGLETLGREADAEAVYERAATVRPTEALAHLNLGNARFRRGDLDGAIVAYRAAIRNDSGLSRAHFYLAVALVNSGRPEEALPSLYDALEFAPGDEEILEVIRQVRAMLGLQPP